MIQIFGHDKDVIGIDIEKENKLDYQEMIEIFHPEEQKYIMEPGNIQEKFYEVWVKKEAFLKAIGIGIIEGLKDFNCVEDVIVYEGKSWYLHQLKIHSGYTSYLCSLCKEIKLTIMEFMPEQLKINLNE